MEKRTAGWRSLALYGAALALCQPLAACGSAETPAASTSDKAAVKNSPAIPSDAPLVIAFGDSLYAGYQLGPNEGLAPQLQAALLADGVTARVQNAGVSGDTTAAGRQRLTYVLDNAKVKPALVLLGLGGNDVLRGIGPDERAPISTRCLPSSRSADPGAADRHGRGSEPWRRLCREINPIFPSLRKYGVTSILSFSTMW